MRKLPWIGVTLAALSALPAIAQGADTVRHDIAADRASIQADRQAIVAEALPLTDDQAKAFWPMFREYRGEMEKLGDRAVNLLLDYAKSFESLTDAQATAMLDEYLAIQRDEAKVKQAWVGKFRKILPPKTVTRFYQIESKLDMILRFEAAAQIPLVEDLQK
jgi:hypothetical protein